MQNKAEEKPKKKLKIAFFIDTFFPMVDGVVMVVDNYTRRLQNIADVTVFTTKPRTSYDDTQLPYKVVRCPRMKIPFLDYDLPLPRLSNKFKKEIKQGNFDIIHIHSPFGVGSMGARYARKLGIPLIATMHSQYKKDFLKETHNNIWLSNKLMRKIMKVFNMCDECWAVNQKVAEIYYNEYGAKTLPQVHNNGTDLKLLKDKSFLEDLKKQLNIKDNESVLLFVGRITVLKNVDFIIKSLQIVKENKIPFKMLFIGSGPDLEKMQELTHSLDLDNQILFLGKITDRQLIAKYYYLADLFLFPSLYDCSSLVQIEAASQKTPAVFIKGAATADTITDNVNGYLADNSINSFADKIIDIISHPQELQKIKEKAYKDLYLSWDDAVDIAYKDYMKMIKEKKHE